MVAVIHSGSSLRNILSYNEQKVKSGAALCLDASDYPKEVADLTFLQKLSRFEKLTELNQATRVNSLHISLNFDPSEKISDDTLRAIAADYIDKIGFRGQPYLLYAHFDAAHPHVHLITTNIKPDGKRISLHNIGRIQSETARKEIEIRYNLIKAEESKLKDTYRLKPVDAAKIYYGLTETKRAMSNVINTVVKSYKFSSIHEFNAVLSLYNLVADRGSESSRIYRNNGLVFHIVDGLGNCVGVPVKASDFYFRPTLKNLSERFVANSASKELQKVKLKNLIDLSLRHRHLSLEHFSQLLKSEGVDTIIRQNKDEVIYGLTYVDHRSKCVFNGSTLGKTYSAKGILEQLKTDLVNKSEAKLPYKHSLGNTLNSQEVDQTGKRFDHNDLADVLMVDDFERQEMDWQLKRARKKRKQIRVEPS